MEQKSKPNTFLHRILILLNIIVAALLLLSEICSMISPAKIWWTELIAISYPYFLIINIVFILFWLFVRIRWTAISLIMVLTGFHYLALFYQVGNGSPSEENDS